MFMEQYVYAKPFLVPSWNRLSVSLILKISICGVETIFTQELHFAITINNRLKTEIVFDCLVSTENEASIFPAKINSKKKKNLPTLFIIIDA